MMGAVKRTVGAALTRSPRPVQTFVKETIELLYWRLNLRRSKGRFYNGHYRTFFTEPFGLDEAHFAGRRMLDIGCGPLGSLEWATEAAERVGLDPLAEDYLRLNGGTQGMRYVRGGSERIPFPDGRFDVVSMFNALDHVEDVGRSVAEAERVLAPGGDLLLIVEIDHPPTITEPHRLGESVLDMFGACDPVLVRIFGMNAAHNVYGSIAEGRPREGGEPGILCARLVKR